MVSLVKPRETGPARVLSGREKAAVIVRLLLSEGAPPPLHALPERMQADLTEQIGRMGSVDRDTLREVVEDFCARIESIGLSFGGSRRLRRCLTDDGTRAEARAGLPPHRPVPGSPGSRQHIATGTSCADSRTRGGRSWRHRPFETACRPRGRAFGDAAGATRPPPCPCGFTDRGRRARNGTPHRPCAGAGA